jgi:HD superfamily phosphohydrolase
MSLDFLRLREKKVVRTALYNDQEFTAWELELLHTPLMQRLYNLKQLGFADRVYPDAVHSRFNHVLGVSEIAERMALRLAQWFEHNGSFEFAYAKDRRSVSQSGWSLESISAAELAVRLRERIPVIRMMGLLHDITHAAFGHTLEDEIGAFAEKHDAPERQARFFDALIGQLLYFWSVELQATLSDPDLIDDLAHLDTDVEQVKACAQAIRRVLGRDERQSLALHLRELEMAATLLNHLDFMHGSDKSVPILPTLLITTVVEILHPEAPSVDIVLHRDAFMIDIVGSTICADLLDYARRDAHNAGLRVQFDDRFIRHICGVSVDGQLSPTGQPCIRLAVQFFTDKMRHDVLSEMSGILKARYLLNERVLFHHAKCAAGAMLGTVVQLLCLTALPPWVQVLGDQEFLRTLDDLSRAMQNGCRQTAVGPGRPASGDGRRGRLESLTEICLQRLGDECSARQHDMDRRIRGARNVLSRLMSRRYAKTVFRIRSGIHHSSGENDETIASRYTNASERFRLEREVERMCHLPPGAISIHCPKRRTSMKAAEALVVGADLHMVAPLRMVSRVTPEPLGPYQKELLAVEQMYRSIWQFHVFLDPSHLEKQALAAAVASNILSFPNDALLERKRAARASSENAYDVLAGPLRGEFPPNLLPEIVRRLDTDARRGDNEPVRDWVQRTIREAYAG